MHTTETTIFIAVLVAALILFTVIALFVIGIVRYYRITMRKQREKISADIMLLEEERLRLAADLHDEFGMLLSTVKITLHCMDINKPGNKMHMQRAELLIDQLMTKVRAVSANLLPLHAREKSLDQALDALMESIKNANIIHLSYSNTLPVIAFDKKMHIYRLIQEITNNTIKHAEAQQMTIRLHGNRKIIGLLILDSGKGFDLALLKNKERGMGLKNIQRRVEIMGGKIYLETAPGKGTKYTIEIPNN